MPALKDLASQIRRDILRMVLGCSSGHPGGSLGCTGYVKHREIINVASLPLQEQ